MSPFYRYEKDRFGVNHWEAGGQERAPWHNSNRELRDEYPGVLERPPGSWEAENHSPVIGIESLHAREHAVLCNLSSFSKIRVWGPGALDFLERMAVSRMLTRDDRAVYTSLLTPRGGIKSDLIIQRLNAKEYLTSTGAAIGMEDLRWLREHLPNDGSVKLANVTDEHAVVALWGPHARAILEQVTDDDVSNEKFPFMDTREIRIMGVPVPVRALRVSFIGELGWEIYIPRYQDGRKNDQNALRVYDALWEAGQRYRIIPMGLNAYRGSLRMEKSFRLLGPQSDLNTEHNLIGAGMLRDKYRYGDDFSRVKSADFIGKQALLRQRDQEGPPEELICTLMMRNPSRIVAAGNWPILDPKTHQVIEYTVNGAPRRSYVTTSDNAYSLSEAAGENIVLAMAYLPYEYAVEGTALEISYFGNRIPAKVVVVGSKPLYDPKNSYTQA